MDPWHEGLRRGLLAVAALTMTVIWLPLVRGFMEGEAYAWRLGFFGAAYSGEGTGGDYAFLVYVLALGLCLLYAGFRGARTPFPVLLIFWFAMLAANALFEFSTGPHGEGANGIPPTFGFGISRLAPTFFVLCLAGALFWTARELILQPKRRLPPWTLRNGLFMALGVVCLVIAYFFLNAGAPGGPTDRIGSGFALAAWGLFCLGLPSWRAKV